MVIRSKRRTILTLFKKGVFSLQTAAEAVKGLASLADHHAGRVGRAAHHLHDERGRK